LWFNSIAHLLGLDLPQNLNTNAKVEVLQSFVGCGHVWRMDAWRTIENYPEWFIFTVRKILHPIYCLRKIGSLITCPKY
jgi:hypothetical protein